MALTQTKKLITGSEIAYSCVIIDMNRYQSAIIDIDPSIYGFVVNGIFKPAEDVTLNCKKDWCLPIVQSYNQEYWAIINKHPGDLYSPMCYITGGGLYRVVTYDIWQSGKGLVAVVTETDED